VIRGGVFVVLFGIAICFPPLVAETRMREGKKHHLKKLFWVIKEGYLKLFYLLMYSLIVGMFLGLVFWILTNFFDWKILPDLTHAIGVFLEAGIMILIAMFALYILLNEIFGKPNE
jgi:hypothetical protein